MLTRREILIQLKRLGVKEFCLLKRHCRDFEVYMAANYDFEILKTGTENPIPVDKQPIRLRKKGLSWSTKKKIQ